MLDAEKRLQMIAPIVFVIGGPGENSFSLRTRKG